ncbi:MAG: PilZ domain-containing protein [Candidatus Omnitrophica bacterium]|nr:PilZ domain-containing protein [Candidatus Omnitrophota bacterium]
MEEKRKYPRYVCGEQRKFVAVYDNTDRVVGDIQDFSRGGIRFASRDPLDEKGQIKLLLQIAGLIPKVPAVIQIVWSKQEDANYIYGAEFLQINPGGKFDIMELLYQDWKRNGTPDIS